MRSKILLLDLREVFISYFSVNKDICTRHASRRTAYQVGSFFILFSGMVMGTKEHTEAMNITAQIKNLRDNNLTIEDEEEAIRTLQHISYYRLIKAYGPSFKDKRTGRYLKDATFKKIYRVYEFDDHLRHLLIPYLQEIEITFRCQITNYFCEKYGVLGYLDRASFDEAASYSELSDKIDRCLEQSKESPIVKNFRNNYVEGKVPLYAAIEIFTFGTLALFYSSMKKEDRKAIAAMYDGVDERYLSSWLVSIGYVRNLCSHFNRLYKKNLVKKPLLYKRQDGDVNNTKLYGVLCCMRYLLKETGEWPTFVNALEDLLDEYSDCVKPSGIGCIEHGWKDKLLDQEPNNIFKDFFAKYNL